MEFRVQNPNASPVTDKDKADLQAALLTLAAVAAPTFDEVRAALPKATRDRLAEDGMLHAAALELGLVVIPSV
jgi:hypothetical protein